MGSSGYLSAFPEEFFDRVETGRKVWAPWYTIHKIGAGLLDMYHLCGTVRALDVLKGMMKWADARTGHLDDARMQTMLAVEHGGMSELLFNLFAVTDDSTYLRLARRFEHRTFLKFLAEGRDELKGLHANTNIPKVIGAARGFELSGDCPLHDATLFFWNQIVRSRSYATGGTSNYEYWRTDPDVLSNELSAETHENCCTYNMLRLTSHVFSWTADPAAADYFERALFNGILPTQKADDGSGIMYYVPMQSGAFKMYGLRDSSYWCCTGTGIESFAKLAQGIYFRNDTSLYVNLFIPSELEWKERGLALRQVTAFPDEEESTIIVQRCPSTPLSLRIRVPAWTERERFTLRLNGKPLEVAAVPSSFAEVRRVWKPGDKLQIRFPMELHLVYMPDDHSRAAILYGPMVLAGALGTGGMSSEMQSGFSHSEVDRMLSEGALPRGVQLVIPSEDVNSWIRPVLGEPLTFRTNHVGKPEDVTLIPFCRLFGQRYAIYWDLVSETDWAILKPQRPLLPLGIMDRAIACDRRSDREHGFQAYHPDTGSWGAERWVQSPFWMRYDLACGPAHPMSLRCRFANEGPAAAFDILLNGQPLSSDTLVPSGSALALESVVPVPAMLINGLDRVAVKLKARDGKPTGRLLSCELIAR